MMGEKPRDGRFYCRSVQHQHAASLNVTAMRYRDADHLATIANEQRRQKTMHMIERRQTQEIIARKHLQATTGIRTAVAQQRLA